MFHSGSSKPWANADLARGKAQLLSLDATADVFTSTAVSWDAVSWSDGDTWSRIAPQADLEGTWRTEDGSVERMLFLDAVQGGAALSFEVFHRDGKAAWGVVTVTVDGQTLELKSCDGQQFSAKRRGQELEWSDGDTWKPIAPNPPMEGMWRTSDGSHECLRLIADTGEYAVFHAGKLEPWGTLAVAPDGLRRPRSASE